jgi:hypothetical protein
LLLRRRANRDIGPYKIIVDKIGDLDKVLSSHRVVSDIDLEKEVTRHIGFAGYNILHAINIRGIYKYRDTLTNHKLNTLVID